MEVGSGSRGLTEARGERSLWGGQTANSNIGSELVDIKGRTPTRTLRRRRGERWISKGVRRNKLLGAREVRRDRAEATHRDRED